MKMRSALAIALVLVLVITTGCLLDDYKPQYYYNLLRHYAPEAPGLGVDSLEPEVAMHHDMAVALYASAEALRAMSTGNETALLNATKAANWLVDNSDLDNDGEVGWGLPTAWDAFQDGSINPANQEYTITTALAIYAFVDIVKALERFPDYALLREGYITTAASAADSFVAGKRYNTTPQGIVFWYSHAEQDSYHVMNVTAMMAGALARLYEYVDQTAKDKYLSLIQSAANYIWEEALEVSASAIGWNYYGEDKKPESLSDTNRSNDLVHGTYIVQGLYDISKLLGHRAELELCFNHLSSFISNGMVREYAPYVDNDTRARLWGAGYALYTLSKVGETQASANLYECLKQYALPSGNFGYRPDDNRIFVRHETHLLLGLAAYELQLK
ncbi:MAG TPA: hypothetical protein DER41_01540 [Firmicutes bacterium]|nr:hypothetical protein [Bacillota bacterium]